jgi:hypothetical protein
MRVVVSTVLCAIGLLALAAQAQVPRFGSEFQVNVYTFGGEDEPAVGCDADGNVLVAWQGRPGVNDHDLVSNIFFRRHDAFGMSLSADVELGGLPPCSGPRISPKMCVDAAGNALVVFRRLGDLDLHGQRYDSTGAPLGAEFEVANIDSSSYFALGLGSHAVACEDAGDFVVVWSAFAGYSVYDGVNVRARRFASGGTSIGSEFQVNTYTVALQPSVASDSDGDFMTATSSSRGRRILSTATARESSHAASTVGACRPAPSSR